MKIVHGTALITHYTCTIG